MVSPTMMQGPDMPAPIDPHSYPYYSLYATMATNPYLDFANVSDDTTNVVTIVAAPATTEINVVGGDNSNATGEADKDCLYD